jgi:hypothetical protein
VSGKVEVLGFDEFFTREWRLARRNQQAFCLLISTFLSIVTNIMCIPKGINMLPSASKI